MLSISLRLQRTTTETAFVSVQVTKDLLIPQPDGSARLDPDKLTARAIEMGGAPDVAWQPESASVAPHPVQVAPSEVE